MRNPERDSLLREQLLTEQNLTKHLTDDRKVEPVGQRQPALVEHEVDDGDVVVILLELGDKLLVEDGLAVLGHQYLVPADHLTHRPENVRAKAPDKLQRKLELRLKTILIRSEK